jgi:hypothetical protein
MIGRRVYRKVDSPFASFRPVSSLSTAKGHRPQRLTRRQRARAPPQISNDSDMALGQRRRR